MTVFNQSNEGFKNKKYPLFLGDDLGLFDTVNIAYPEIERLYQQQLSQLWNEHEVDLTQDRMDMLKVPKVSSDLMVKTLSWQHLADSVASRSIAGLLLPHCTNSELEGMLTIQAFYEVVHARTYSHIVKQTFADPNVMLKQTYEDVGVLLRSEAIVNAFDELENLPKNSPAEEKRKILLKVMVALFALEAIAFMSSFAVTFALAETGVFQGIGALVALIARDESVTPETEVLTPSGWKRIDEFNAESDTLLQFDPQTREVKFVKPSRMVTHKEDVLYKFTTGQKGYAMSQRVTPNHRMLRRTKTKDTYSFHEAKDVKYNCYHFFPVSGWKDGEEGLSFKDRFFIAAQADGSASDRYTGERCGTRPVMFKFSKGRKIERFMWIIENLGWSMQERSPTKAHGAVKARRTFSVDVPINDFREIKSFSWVDLSTMSRRKAEEFLEELVEWDGYKSKDPSVNYLYYSSTSKHCVDMVQAIAVLCEKNVNLSVQKDNRSEKFNDIHRCYIYDRYECRAGGVKKEQEVYGGDVYCVTVPSQAFVIRHDDVVSITGNCLHSRMDYTVLDILLKDPEWKSAFEEIKPQLQEILDAVVEQEVKWADYLFGEGRSVVGLNARLLKDYTLFMSLPVYQFLDIPFVHKQVKENPLPYMDKYIDPSQMQSANQEIQNTAYNVGAIENDTQDLNLDMEF